MGASLKGLRTVIFPTADLAGAKKWWVKFLGFDPYFDEPFYIGFNVAGYELGLLPDTNPTDGALTYWGVDDVSAAIKTAIEAGATEHSPATEVGEGIITGSIRTPQGSIVGLIYNPHFNLD